MIYNDVFLSELIGSNKTMTTVRMPVSGPSDIGDLSEKYSDAKTIKINIVIFSLISADTKLHF